MNELFKKEVILFSLSLLHIRADNMRIALRELREGMAGEGKSTAGDKHDTAIAMVQIECERIERQLADILDQTSKVERLQRNVSSLQIQEGSLFSTNLGVFYMSVPLGKQVIQDKAVIFLSVQSPLGKVFLSKKQGDRVLFNKQEYLIDQLV
jgi:hypothetical protein